MASRKRTSDTEIIHNTTAMTESSTNTNTKPNAMATATATTNKSSRLRVRVKRFHAVARWTWNAGSEDEVCGICQSAFEGVAPGIKYPGDECPVVFGKCGHAFHLQCVATWLNSSRQTCPICRADWEYGQSTDQRRNESN
jgi:anaphase-promoting complex subunit 11